MNFETTTYDIETKVGQPYELSYFYKGEQEIVDIAVSCGCTKATLENNILKVTYVATPVAPQLNTYPYTTSKTIIVTYKDWTSSILKFNATVYAN